MTNMIASNLAQTNLQAAKKYISLLETRDCHNSMGKFSIDAFQTVICWQQYEGAQNYHKCSAFDAAFAEVIKENIKPLSEAVIHKLQTRFNKELLAEEQSLRDRLALIEEAKIALRPQQTEENKNP